MAKFPLRKYIPGMHGSSVDSADIAPGTVVASDIAALAVTTAKLAVGVLSADAPGRALFAAGILDTATLLSVIATDAMTEANILDIFLADSMTEANVDAVFAAGAIAASDRL